jgi:hypothetical protein
MFEIAHSQALVRAAVGEEPGEKPDTSPSK